MPRPTPASRSLLRDLARLDRSRMSARMALRNTLGVVLPIVAGEAAGHAGAGIIAGVGGLIVSYSDGNDPYRHRARRLFATAVFTAASVGLGTLAANLPHVASALAVGWAFCAGLAAALGQTAGDLGTFSLVMFVVECTHPLPLEAAGELAGLSLAGGLLQMALALVLWPLRKYEPERRELGKLFAAFAEQSAAPSFSLRSPAMTAEMTRAQASLTSLVGDRSLEGHRYRSLLNQAERMRLRLISLAHARRRLSSGPDAAVIERFLGSAVSGFRLVSRALVLEEIAGPPALVLAGVQQAADEMRALAAHEKPLLAAVARHAALQMGALAGQLRAALDLAQGLTEPGLLVQYAQETRRAWPLRVTGALATLRANLTPRSTLFRHAVRLAAGVAIGEAISRVWDHSHAYWLPMTVAIVLKPGYAATISRGTLRVFGTLLGLVFTTALFAIFHPGVPAQIVLIALHTFVLRWLGTANYGFFAATVGGLIVLFASVAGANPMPLIEARALYTVFGGLVAVIIYVLWPTRGEAQAGDAVARLLETYRGYFDLVARKLRGLRVDDAALDRSRAETRVARTNAEAAVDALGGEPSAAGRRALYGAIGASCNRFIQSVMVLNAMEDEPIRDEAFDAYCTGASATLLLLVRALRGESVAARDFADLRESYERCAKSGAHPLVVAELDRMTNSLNTLAERVAILKRSGT